MISQPGKGSTFSFTVVLPLGSAESIVANPFEASHDKKHDSCAGSADSPDDIQNRSKLKGARVLLVEDNAINRQVAGEMLAQLGVQVAVAQNGQEAVDLICGCQGEKTDFHAVLMDIQMPIMDGYEATRRIRAEKRFCDLPIIAMTAHALTEERERCLDVGMNEHCTKPIDPLNLEKTLCRHIHRKNQRPPFEPTNSTPRVAAPENEALPASLPGINIALGLKRIGGRKALLRQLLIQFAEEFTNASKEMHIYLEAGELQQAQRLAHNLKGVGGNLGAEALAGAAAEFERAFQQCDSGNFAGLMDRMDEKLKEVLNSIASLSPLPDGATPAAKTETTFDQQQVCQLLLEMRQRLRENDLIEEDMLGTLQTVLTSADCQKEVRAMLACIETFDYDAALSGLDSLARTVGIDLEQKG